MSNVRVADERLDKVIRERWARFQKEGTEEIRLGVVRLFAGRPWEGAMLGLFDAAEDGSEQVRLAALTALTRAVGVRTLEVRRAGARVLANRLKSEKSPRALEAIYGLASGGTYCNLGDDDDTHRCSPALLRALQQLGRKGEHRAIRVLASHPSVEAVETLLGLLVDMKDPPEKQSCATALSELTGVNSNSYDPQFWKQQLTPLSPKTKARLATLAQQDHAKTKALQDAADTRVKELQKGH